MPAAAGFIDVALIAIVGILLMLAYTLYIIGNNSPDIPFAGNVIKDYVTDPLASLLEDLGDYILHTIVIDTTVAAFHESMQAMRNGDDLSVHLWNFVNSVLWDSYDLINPGIRAILDYAIGYDVRGQLQYLDNYIGAVDFRLVSLANLVDSSPQITQIFDVVNPAISDFLGQFNPAAFDLVTNVANTAFSIAENVYGTEVSIITVDLPAIRNELDYLAGIVADLGGTTLDFPPGVLDLINAIPGIRDAEGIIEGILGNIGDRVGALEGEITGVLPLTVIAALGATAIDTLVNLAEDPCFCFNLGGGMEWMKLAVIDQMILNGT